MSMNKIKALLSVEGDNVKTFLQGYDPIYAMSAATRKVVITLEQLMVDTGTPVVDGQTFLVAARKLQGSLLLENGYLPDLLVLLTVALAKDEIELAKTNNATNKAILNSGLVEVWEASVFSALAHSNGEKIVYVHSDPNEEPIITLLRACRWHCLTSEFVLVTDPISGVPLGAMRHYDEETIKFMKDQQCGILNEYTANRLKETYFAETHGLVIINERDLTAYHTTSGMRFEYRTNFGGLL